MAERAALHSRRGPATFDWALLQHASTLNLKSRPIPAEYRDIVDKALLRIGYRFRVNKLAFATPIKAGNPLTINVTGVMMASPCLSALPVQWRVVNAAGATVTQLKTQDDAPLAAGDMQSTVTLTLPTSLPAGDYALQTAITDAQGKPRLLLANQGKTADGWYQLTTFSIK